MPVGRLPDSRQALEFLPSLGLKKGYFKPRNLDVQGVVLHSTGYGPIRRWKLGEAATPLDAAVKIYTKIYRYSPHYVVDGVTGECVQVNPETVVAQHVGKRLSNRYRNKWWLHHNPACQWWAEDYPDYASPLELPVWEGGSCNEVTLAIEVVPPSHDVRAPWSDDCWLRLRRLTGEFSTIYKFPRTKEHVLSHAQAHPLARTSRGAPWDPYVTQWSIEQATAHGLYN